MMRFIREKPWRHSNEWRAGICLAMNMRYFHPMPGFCLLLLPLTGFGSYKKCDTCTAQEFQNYTVARDTFLAHLGATLWGSMRHIISPSVADGAFHHYEKISFQLFFITQEVCNICLRMKYFCY